MQLNELFDIQSHIHQLSDLLKKTKGDPEAFYTAGGRNIFFRLETLARIAGGLGDKDDFEEARNLFKESEDLLGEYDFYAAYLNTFHENKSCRLAFLEIFDEQLEESEEALRDNLKRWSDKDVIEKVELFYKRCQKISFDTEAEFAKAFSRFIIKSTEKIIRDYKEGVYHTNDVEAGLHELRRKLRWISLYVQVAGGIIQHRPSKHQDSKFATYTTKETLSSPFMKLPEHPSFRHPVILRTETYAALSWMIAVLGKYKDEALSQTLFDHHPTLKNCYELTKPEEHSRKEILKKVNAISQQFFDEDRIPDEIIHDLQAYA